MSEVINFPDHEQRASDRIGAIHLRHLSLDAFTSELGTPDEWLGSAIDHAKVVMDCGSSDGTVTVSEAALSLMVMKLEELLYDGPKVALPIQD